MKRFLMGVLMIALLLGSLPAAFAEPLCDASEVDLSGVREIGGRLVGEIRIPDGLLGGRLLIDCLVPEGFAQEQSQTLTVAYRKISKKEMTAALRAIGQTLASDSVYVFNGNPQTSAEYAPLSCGDPGYYFKGQLMNAAASADPAYDAQYAQAKAIVRELLAQLGGTTYDDLLHAMRLDAEHSDLCSSTADSSGGSWKTALVESFARMQEKYNLTPDTLTMVSGLYDLYGLPVMSQIQWTEGRDRVGAETAYFAAVHDGGILQYCKVECLPMITAEDPVSIPARSWQELLSGCVANNWCLSNARGEDYIFVDIHGQSITEYATYAVITELHPCWVGNGPHTLVPGYYLNIEDRVANDNTLKDVLDTIGDAETLTRFN